MADGKCEVHYRIEKDVDELRTTQKERHCQEHSSRIGTLEKETVDQWTAINELRRTVWMWRGAMALAGFAGSAVGGLVISYLRRP